MRDFFNWTWSKENKSCKKVDERKFFQLFSVLELKIDLKIVFLFRYNSICERG